MVIVNGKELPDNWNWVLGAILDTLEATGCDPAYVEEKSEELYKLNGKYECFSWAVTRFDSVRLPIFAEKMNLSVEQCKIFADVWRKL